MVIGVTWINHHATFTRLAVTDTTLLTRNLLFLLGVSVLPFPTSAISGAMRAGSKSDRVTAVTLFSVVMIALIAAAMWLCLHVVRTPALLANPEDGVFFHVELRRHPIGMIPPAVAIGVAFLSPVAALVVLALLPTFYMRTIKHVQ